jgi:streptogramin lyase
MLRFPGRSRWRRVGAAAIGIAAGAAMLAVAAAQMAPPPGTVVAGGLTAPRGLTATADGSVLIATGGGSVHRLNVDGSLDVLVSGMATETGMGPEGVVTTRPTAAIPSTGGILVTVGEPLTPGLPGFQAVFFVPDGGQPVLVADLGAFERANNTDDGTGPTGEPDFNSNPFDLVSDGAGGLLISDSGANAIIRLSPEGTLTPFAIFPARENPLFPGLGGPTMQQVPTGITQGPDGAFYVTTLTGFPFPQGEARVYRLQDLNADADALDAGETTVFDGAGNLLVTEFSTNILAQAPGRLVRIVGGQPEVHVPVLITPTGVVVTQDGRILVSQEFTGLVTDATALVGQQPPPAPAGTGNAGLGMPSETGVPQQAAALAAALALLSIGALATRRVLRR